MSIWTLYFDGLCEPRNPGGRMCWAWILDAGEHSTQGAETDPPVAHNTNNVAEWMALGYGIRAIIRVGRAEYARVVKLVQQTPEVVNAYNVTGEDSWILEIAVIDVAHLDAVVTKFCLLTETSTAIILNTARAHQVMLPPRREDVKPPIRKVENA